MIPGWKFYLLTLTLVTAATISFNTSTKDKQMITNIVNPPALYNPAPNGYSHVVIAENAKRIAYIAGQGGEDASGQLQPEFAPQVEQAYKNLKLALDAIHAAPNQVTKMTTYVVAYDPSMLEVMTHYVTEMFGANLPAQTLVPVPRLALDGMLFEVDAIVVLD